MHWPGPGSWVACRRCCNEANKILRSVAAAAFYCMMLLLLLQAISAFVEQKEWIDFLCPQPALRSNTSMTFVLQLSASQLKKMTKLLADEEVAFDINSYRCVWQGLW